MLTRWRTRKFYQRVMKEAETPKGSQQVNHFLYLGLITALPEQSGVKDYQDSLKDWVIGTEAEYYLAYSDFLKMVQSEEFRALFKRDL